MAQSVRGGSYTDYDIPNKINYSARVYVVLLLVGGKETTSASSGCVPTGWVYQLKSPCSGNNFWPMLDPNGSTSNGYNGGVKVNLRLATPEEIVEYLRLGKPYDAGTLVPRIINEYPIF